MDLNHFRQEYTPIPFSREHLEEEPLTLFQKWLEDAIIQELLEPNAMILSTVSEEGMPDSRTVLLKKFDKRGLIFYTNYKSKKAKHIRHNPNVSLCFLWTAMQRQVRILGRAEKLSQRESEQYFKSRPHGSQIGSWASPQSEIIEQKAILEQKFAHYEEKFAHKTIPLPPHWGGYLVKPVQFEFWKGNKNRMHDRFRYEKAGEKWEIHRLAP